MITKLYLRSPFLFHISQKLLLSFVDLPPPAEGETQKSTPAKRKLQQVVFKNADKDFYHFSYKLKAMTLCQQQYQK